MDGDGSTDGSAVPPARDPRFAAEYLAREGLTLGAAPMAVPPGVGDMPVGPELAAVLAGLDPQRMHGGHLTEMVRAYPRLIAHLGAGLLEVVWELARTPVADGGTVVRTDEANRFAGRILAPLMTWTTYRAERMVTLARLAVHTAPMLLAAMREGRLDLAKLQVIATELEAITDEEAIRAIVEEILGDIETHSTGTLAHRIRRVIGSLDPDAVRKSREQKIRSRRMARVDAPGGLTRLVLGSYDAAAVAAAYDHVNSIAQAMHTSGDVFDRSLDQLRADIALDLLRGVTPATAGQATPGDRKGTINLTVGLSTLAGLDDDSGQLAGYGPVTADIARQTVAQFAGVCRWRFNLHDDDGRLLAQGHVSRAATAEIARHLRAWAVSHDMWYGPGELHRHPVDATAGPDGRAHREPTAAQKAFVRARDTTCQFPGCRVPARRCQIDHRVAWIDRGPTTVGNLYAVCAYHHRAKHLGGFSYQPAVGGMVWTAPRGHRYLTQREPPGGLRQGRHRSPLGTGSVLVELVGYTHTPGAPPRLRH